MAAKTEKRTIAHALFTYVHPVHGGSGMAFRGDTVDLLADDIERGEKFDAFTDKVGVKPTPQGSTLAGFPAEGDAEQDAWVKSGTIEEIMTAVREDPAIAPKVLKAEERRKDQARKGLLEALASVES